MVKRLILVLLAVVISTPVYADCPVQQRQPAHDCCHKSKDCPQPAPIQAQRCLDCIADVRSTAELAGQPLSLGAAAILPGRVSILSIGQVSAVPQVPLTDHSSTYLRIGVLRL